MFHNSSSFIIIYNEQLSNSKALQLSSQPSVIVNGRPGMSRTKKHIKRAMNLWNLVFVPPADVPRALREINALFPHDARFDNFVLYFTGKGTFPWLSNNHYPLDPLNHSAAGQLRPLRHHVNKDMTGAQLSGLMTVQLCFGLRDSLETF